MRLYIAHSRNLCLLNGPDSGLVFRVTTTITLLRLSAIINQFNLGAQGLPDFISIELFYDQLPLAVPCYDLVPVTKFTFGHFESRLRVPPASLT